MNEENCTRCYYFRMDGSNRKSERSIINISADTESPSSLYSGMSNVPAVMKEANGVNKFCSVPILQKVLEPSPGYQSRLYSVQVMRISDAEDYYQNIRRNSNQEDQQVPAQSERERSPTRDSKPRIEHRNPLECKEFAQQKAECCLQSSKMLKTLFDRMY